MHAAPSVNYPVGRSRFLAVLLGVVWLCGAAALVVAAIAWTPGWRHVVGALALLASTVGAWQFWHSHPVGVLRWDGRAWQGPGSAEPARLEVHLDLQHRLLARLVATQGPHRASWLWLEAGADPPRWADLRRAVYSRAAPAVAQDIHLT